MSNTLNSLSLFTLSNTKRYLFDNQTLFYKINLSNFKKAKYGITKALKATQFLIISFRKLKILNGKKKKKKAYLLRDGKFSAYSQLL